MAVPFVVGDVSRLAADVLALVVLVYAYGTARFAVRGFAAGLQDRWSAFVATLVMAALAFLLAWRGERILPAPFSIWALGFWAGGVAFTLTYTLGRIHDRIERFQHEFGARLSQLLERRGRDDILAELGHLRARWHERREERRKTVHLLMAAFIAMYAVVGLSILRAIWNSTYGGVPAGGEGVTNLFLASHAEPGTFLVAGHVASVFTLLAVLFVVTPTELMRLRFPETGYPFKALILNNLRAKESGLFGAHYYILAALALAALWLTRDPASWPHAIPAVIAVIAVTVFADSASALVGVRWGRMRWPHNHGKTLVGTAGGTFVAFAVALPFVGPIAAAAAGIAFMVVDIAAPVPVPVSDNLLNPIVLAATFTLLGPWLAPLIPFY